jgi:xanthine dehydrogenase small subunit
MKLSLTVNGKPYELETDPGALLLRTLREDLGLRGTKYGCGEGECGACTVLLDGRAVNACLTTAGQAHGREVVTIEGLAGEAAGAALIDAFGKAGAVQCGFCTPGFVVAAHALLAETGAPDIGTIQRGLSGNLCRCTGYAKIVAAVAGAAQAIQPASAAEKTSHVESIAGTTFARPDTLGAALDLLGQSDRQWRAVAGGTDVFVQHEHRLDALNLLDMGGLNELQGIRETGEEIRIGALTPYSEVIGSPLAQEWAAPLIMAAREVGGAQIQNMGTVAGNLANASPAADSLPPLFVLGANVTLQSSRGQRSIPVQDVVLGPGRTSIAPDELIVEISIPKRRHDGQEIAFFEKVGPRKAMTIAKASVAFRGWLDTGRLAHVEVALGAVAPTVVFAPETAAALMAGRFEEATLLRAADAAQHECRPIDDIRSTAAYRRRLVRGLLIRNLWPFLPQKLPKQPPNEFGV